MIQKFSQERASLGESEGGGGGGGGGRGGSEKDLRDKMKQNRHYFSSVYKTARQICIEGYHNKLHSGLAESGAQV